MLVQDLLDELAGLQVAVSITSGKLMLSAKKGVLTDELRGRVADSKAELLRVLRDAASQMPPPALVAEHRDGVPFPLPDLQLGFYVADDPHMEFHVRPHCYMEFDRHNLDVAAYERAWNLTLQRHRRELCVVAADGLLRTLEDIPPLRVDVKDLRGLDPRSTHAALASLRTDAERRELPLDRWPWFDLRISLRRENGVDVWRIHYNHNSYFIDGYGTSLLLAEVESYCRAPEKVRPPLELAYRDAVLGLEDLSRSAQGDAAREYWFSRLPQLPAPPSLPLRLGISRRRRSYLVRREYRLDPQDWAAFKARAAARGVTPSNALICAYAHVLARWSNSDHFILSQMATRRFPDLHPDLMEMLGNFVSLYPLEVQLAPAQPFIENVRILQDQVLRDTRHLQLGGMRVLQELNRLKGSFGSAPSPFVVGSGLFLRRIQAADYTVLETCQTMLDHQFFELEGGQLHVVWDVLEEFFPTGLIDAMWEAYLALLSLLSKDDAAWSDGHPDLCASTDLPPRRQRNEAAASVLPDACLHSALAHQAQARPEAPMLWHEGRSFNHAELDRRSEAIAAHLFDMGVRRGDRVAVVMGRSDRLLCAVHGVLRAGAAYVPVDPTSPPDRIALLLEDTGVTVALADRASHGNAVVSRRVLVLDEATCVGALAAGSEAVGPDDLAYVIHTSGSTGRPKGVMVDHRSALNTIVDINARFEIGTSDVLLGVSAFNFDLSVYDLFGAVAAGARLVFPDAGRELDPMHWLQLVQEEGVTVWNSVPALLRLLLESAQRRNTTLPSLRRVLLSGDKIPLDLPEQLRRIAPGADLISLGGATEASIWSNHFQVDALDPQWATIPYGYPLANQRWRVLDRHGFDCPTWVPGELHIGGHGLAWGYWGDPARTALSFQPDDQQPGRLYRTGDIGRYVQGGCLEWMGRNDFQVKIQGHRIEPGEIESALLDHPQVAQAAVVAPEERGERRRLVAHLVAATEAAIPAASLEELLRRRLPHYMVPSAWRFWDALPLSSNGKVDRGALDHASLEAATLSEPARGMEPPRDLVERQLLSFWKTVLDRDDFGVTDDFFELGGQSFDAIRIFALVRETFACSYTLAHMWENRSIRGLARTIATAGSGAASESATLVSIGGAAVGIPLFLVHPAGGSAMGYVELGKSLACPVFGIQAAPPQPERELEIHQLAADYAAAVRRLVPVGPYRVGGWSSGAMIAFEVALQLEASGHEVLEVLLLDGPTPHPHDGLTEANLLRWFVQDLALDLTLEHLQTHDDEELPLPEQFVRWAAQLDLEGLTGLAPDALLPGLLTFCAMVRAGDRYRPGTINADITVVRVANDIVQEFADHPHRHESDWGWGRHTRGRTHCVKAPGDHYSFLAQPHLADWLARIDPEADPHG